MAIKADITTTARPDVRRLFLIPQSVYGPGDVLDSIYDFVMSHTRSHEESEEAMCWVEMACVGETYETDEIFIEMIDDEDY